MVFTRDGGEGHPARARDRRAPHRIDRVMTPAGGRPGRGGPREGGDSFQEAQEPGGQARPVECRWIIARREAESIAGGALGDSGSGG